ncbi:NUDIX domain-containing protein [Streptomyces sp. NBC_01244]|uniref:NUDIX domain-containing protein n=1 Tax=Streptomyces sp. NBC_01244 TaxID=2903797 RepID=UPI002E10BDB1|nr:NUDIX domain-containing protein [Streptomyces sp. NBC_01244]
MSSPQLGEGQGLAIGLATAVYITHGDDAGPLLVRSARTGRWMLPAGYMRPGEDSPLQTAGRMLQEATGLALQSPAPLLAIDFHPATARAAPYQLMVFDGGHLTGRRLNSVRLPDRYDRYETPPFPTLAALEGTTPLLAEFLKHVRKARTAYRPVLLQAGRQVSFNGPGGSEKPWDADPAHTDRHVVDDSDYGTGAPLGSTRRA